MVKAHKKTRHNGEGSLERKPNGVYIVRWSKDGKRFSRTTGETDLEKAEEKRRQIMQTRHTLCHTYKEIKIRKDVYDKLIARAGGRNLSAYLDELVSAGESEIAKEPCVEILENPRPPENQPTEEGGEKVSAGENETESSPAQ